MVESDEIGSDNEASVEIGTHRIIIIWNIVLFALPYSFMVV